MTRKQQGCLILDRAVILLFPGSPTKYLNRPRSQSPLCGVILCVFLENDWCIIGKIPQFATGKGAIGYDSTYCIV